MKKIDIHADDYGYTLQTSKEILDCIKQEKLDSISIICNTSFFDESMELLYKEIPNLKVLPLMSVHINLVEGYSLSNGSLISNDGILNNAWGKLFANSFTFNRKQLENQIIEEIELQIEKVQNAIEKCFDIAKDNDVIIQQKGVRLDSHVHTHLIPLVWSSLIKAIDKNDYEIEYIRNPKEPITPFISKTNLWNTYNFVNIIKNRILMILSYEVDKYFIKRGLKHMHMIGLMMSGEMDYNRTKEITDEYCKIYKNKDYCLEVLCHPGKANIDELRTELNKKYFNAFNSSKNRTIEKECVMNIRCAIGENHG